LKIKKDKNNNEIIKNKICKISYGFTHRLRLVGITYALRLVDNSLFWLPAFSLTLLQLLVDTLSVGKLPNVHITIECDTYVQTLNPKGAV